LKYKFLSNDKQQLDTGLRRYNDFKILGLFKYPKGHYRMLRCKAQYEEAHPAYAGYTPQMLAQRMPGAFFNSHTLR